MPRIITTAEAALRGARRENGEAVKTERQQPVVAPIKMELPEIDTSPMAREIGKMAMLVQATLQTQTAAIDKIANQQHKPKSEAWDFQVVERDAQGRISRIRVDRVPERKG